MIRKQSRSRKVAEAIFILAAIAIVFYLVHHHTPHILKILESGNINDIDTYLKAHGKEGILLLIVLQAIETISIVIPAAPVYICAGILLGKLGGIIVCYLTNLVLSVMIFLGAKHLHLGKSRSLDLGKQKYIGPLIQNAKHMDRVIVILCFLPVFPTCMIPFFSAEINVTLWDYVRAMAIGTLPSIAIYVCCGDILISDSYKIIIAVIIVLAILSFFIFLFRKKLLVWIRPKLKSFLEG